MPFGFECAAANPGDLAHQELVHDQAGNEDRRTCDQRGDIWGGFRAENRVRSEQAERVIGDVHTEHHEVALRKIDDAHDAEDQTQPDAHQAIQRAGEQAGSERLQEILRKLGGIHR